MKQSLIVAMLCLAMLVGSIARAEDTRVVVGVYNFPPMAHVAESGHLTGLLADLLDEINSRQRDYTFDTFTTSPKRRHLDFQQRRFDLIFFESRRWSWEGIDHHATRPILADGEHYIALRKPGRDQSFFDDIPKRRLVAMLGYHYGFADRVTDADVLRQRFDIELTQSHSRNIDLIMADRPSLAEVAVVSRSYLNLYLEQNPGERNRLLVSDRTDQEYELRVLVHPESPISAEKIEALLQELVTDGTYHTLAKKYWLQVPPALSKANTQEATPD